MNKGIERGIAYLSNPLVGLLAGVAVGFLLCWFTMVRPLVVHLDQREQSLREWERINRQEREAIADIKTIGTEELRKWVSTLDEQNTRYAQLQSLLHKQELSLVGPATTHLWISLLAVLGVIAFAMWMMRDGNADAARTLHSAVAVLPSLREALREKRTLLEPPTFDNRTLPASSSTSGRVLPNNRKSGKVTCFFAEKAYGFIASNDGGDEVFFHSDSVKLASDSQGIREGDVVSFRLSSDRSGRPCAEDVEIES